MSSSTAEIKAQSVVVTDESLTVKLNDGRSISVPLAWYPRLLHGAAEHAELAADRKSRRDSLA